VTDTTLGSDPCRLALQRNGYGIAGNGGGASVVTPCIEAPADGDQWLAVDTVRSLREMR